MSSDDVNWASVEGLRSAAIRIEREGRNLGSLLSSLHEKIGGMIIDPATFGGDKGGREFYAAWEPYVRRWYDGVRDVSDRVVATAVGVDGMADAVARADKDSANMADDLYQNIANGATPGTRGTGTGTGSGVPNIPSLTPPPGAGGGGSGNTGGGTGGRH
ncbi:hypothetical protein AB0E59_42395 [Lentzea sp. NPDC034063]|uniref:WXG100 family type VII secretion target n=1 Tax=unclassified Lentzea TaxID=2643253 RepID=UPI0033CAFA42